MHYLNSYFTGEASNVLSNLTVTNSYFLVAWDMLVDQYENKHRLIALHLRSLFALPMLIIETVNSLRTIRDQVSSATQALRNLKHAVDQWDDMLVFLITEKLDSRRDGNFNSVILKNIRVIPSLINFSSCALARSLYWYRYRQRRNPRRCSKEKRLPLILYHFVNMFILLIISYTSVLRSWGKHHLKASIFLKDRSTV